MTKVVLKINQTQWHKINIVVVMLCYQYRYKLSIQQN